MAQLTLTEAAASQIQHLMAEEKNPQLMLRVTILGGGCSGFQYTFLLDDKTQDDDQIFENHGVKVVSDTVSLDLLDGSEIDYVQEMIGASFVVRNPNATSGCGCGSSFSVE